jgi:hypothetical protein
MLPRTSMYTLLFKSCRMSSNNTQNDLRVTSDELNRTMGWRIFFCSYQLMLDLKFGLSFSFQITEDSFRLGYYRRRRVELQNQTLYRDKTKRSRREQALFRSLEKLNIKVSTYVFIVLSNKVTPFRIPKRQAEKYSHTVLFFQACSCLPNAPFVFQSIFLIRHTHTTSESNRRHKTFLSHHQKVHHGEKMGAANLHRNFIKLQLVASDEFSTPPPNPMGCKNRTALTSLPPTHCCIEQSEWVGE